MLCWICDASDVYLYNIRDECSEEGGLCYGFFSQYTASWFSLLSVPTNVQGIILLLIQAINHKYSPIFTRKHYFGCKDNHSVILLKHGANPYGTVCFAREVIRTYRPKCIYTSPWADDSSAVQYNIYVTHSRSNGAFSAQQNGKYVLKTFCALHLGWVSLMLNFVPSIFGSPTDSPYCFIG